MSARTQIQVVGSCDEIGEPELFTWDLFPIVPAELTQHLDTEGLPRLGTQIKRGMILVGKIGKSARYTREQEPNSLQIHSFDFSTLNSKFGHLFVDRSRYAGNGETGIVVAATTKVDNGVTTAIIELQQGGGDNAAV